MENEYGINTLKTKDGSAMKPPGQREGGRSHEDILARRVKNRERQRRYRARKRLEADMKKAYNINQSTPLLLQTQKQNEFIYKCTNCVPCHRNWKKDARRVHISKTPDISQSSEPQLPSLNIPNLEIPNKLSLENKEKQLSEDELKSEHLVSLNDSIGANGVTQGRKDWKMAARNIMD